MSQIKIENPEKFRSNIVNKLNAKIENAKNSANLEKGIFNYSLKEAEQRNNAARNAFRHEGGMVSYEKDPKTGKVVRGRRTKDGFTPDT